MLHTTLDLASALGIPMEKLLPARSQNPDEREQMIHRLPDEESKVFVMKVLQDKGVRK